MGRGSGASEEAARSDGCRWMSHRSTTFSPRWTWVSLNGSSLGARVTSTRRSRGLRMKSIRAMSRTRQFGSHRKSRLIVPHHGPNFSASASSIQTHGPHRRISRIPRDNRAPKRGYNRWKTQNTLLFPDGDRAEARLPHAMISVVPRSDVASGVYGIPRRPTYVPELWDALSDPCLGIQISERGFGES
jgi:hypothetical protein